MAGTEAAASQPPLQPASPLPPRLPYAPGTWSYERCMGELQTSVGRFSLTRNLGGGTSKCCSMHPVTAPSRAYAATLQVSLLPLEAGKASRNGGRVYLADTCDERPAAPELYAALPLVGRTISVTVDVSEASCGCVVAFYLSFLRDAPAAGQCAEDWYCDANSVMWDRTPHRHPIPPRLIVSLSLSPLTISVQVCGTRCAEVDIIEANQYAFQSALHEATDNAGATGGPSRADYGPNAEATIVTTRPYRVHAFFAQDGRGRFASMTTTLEQEGRSVRFTIDAPGRRYDEELAARQPDAPLPPPPPPAAPPPSPCLHIAKQDCPVRPKQQCAGVDNRAEAERRGAGVESASGGAWPCRLRCCPMGHACQYVNPYFSSCVPYYLWDRKIAPQAMGGGGSAHRSASLAPLARALKRGMTPVFSYWSAASVGWLDGGKGCEEDQAACGPLATFGDLAVCEDGPLCAFDNQAGNQTQAGSRGGGGGAEAAAAARSDERHGQTSLAEQQCEDSLPPWTDDFTAAPDRADGGCRHDDDVGVAAASTSHPAHAVTADYPPGSVVAEDFARDEPATGGVGRADAARDAPRASTTRGTAQDEAAAARSSAARDGEVRPTAEEMTQEASEEATQEARLEAALKEMPMDELQQLLALALAEEESEELAAEQTLEAEAAAAEEHARARPWLGVVLGGLALIVFGVLALLRRTLGGWLPLRRARGHRPLKLPGDALGEDWSQEAEILDEVHLPRLPRPQPLANPHDGKWVNVGGGSFAWVVATCAK